MGSWVIKTEEETQDWWYQNLKRFGYNPQQAFPKNDERQTRRVKRETAVEGTILYDNFKPLDLIVKTYMDDGLPIISITKGFKGGVVFDMGVLKMSYILKHGPDEKGGFTTEENVTRHGKYKDKSFAEAIKDLLAQSEKERSVRTEGSGSTGINVPNWTKNPKDGSLWPQGFNDYEASNEELARWIKQNYPDTIRVIEEFTQSPAAKDLEEIKMTPDKNKFREHIEDLEKKAFGGGSMAVYESVSDWDIEEYNDFWHVTLPANAVVIKPILLRKGFIELDEMEMQNQLTLPDTQVPPYVKEVLMLMQAGDQGTNHFLIRPPKGTLIGKSFGILKVKETDWKTILKFTSLVPHEELVGTLQQLKNTYPSVFMSEIDENNLTNTIMEFRTSIDSYKEHGHKNVLELDKLKVVLENLSEGVDRLEQLA